VCSSDLKYKFYPVSYSPAIRPVVSAKPMLLFRNYKVIIISLSLISLLSYLVVVNRTNTMGYEIAEMQLKIKNLREQYRDLESRSTELQSMQRIKEISNNSLSMVEADSFDYLTPKPTAVAVK
jgi:cell division protein FtsL